MQIHHNTTGMPAGLTVTTDKDGRDHCVVVVKGTFAVGPDGEALPAEEQEPLVTADAHLGDPGASSILYECEFAPFKPRADLLVNAQAHAPGGRPAAEVTVVLEIGPVRKELRVVGDRRWRPGILSFGATDPVPFVTMPLIYERAFGGSDHSHPDPKHHGTDVRNTVGIGFHKNSGPSTIDGQPLPNLEHPKHPVRAWSDAPPPIGLGVVGRNWQPRLRFAGTYDERWRAERFPFLPADFDPQYFQAAPADQQVPHFQGGEIVRCTNMSPEGTFECRVPRFDLPVVFRFQDRDVPAAPALDTLIVEPDRRRVLALWRASAPLGRKWHALREVVIGASPRPAAAAAAAGKRRFGTLAELAAWNRARGVLPARRPQT